MEKRAAAVLTSRQRRLIWVSEAGAEALGLAHQRVNEITLSTTEGSSGGRYLGGLWSSSRPAVPVLRVRTTSQDAGGGELRFALGCGLAEAQALAARYEAQLRQRRVAAEAGGGISALERRAAEARAAREAMLSKAFADLSGLMRKAGELIELARHFERSGGMAEPALAELALSLGVQTIASPVTREQAGGGYLDRLAAELAQVLAPEVRRAGGCLALPDAFCIYNRARGLPLVSPQDFVQACERLERARLPVRLRRFQSGLLALEDAEANNEAAVAARIQAQLRVLGSLTALDWARLTGLSPQLALEQLLRAEAAGLLCRDDTFERLAFYENFFASAIP